MLEADAGNTISARQLVNGCTRDCKTANQECMDGVFTTCEAQFDSCKLQLSEQSPSKCEDGRVTCVEAERQACNHNHTACMNECQSNDGIVLRH